MTKQTRIHKYSPGHIVEVSGTGKLMFQTIFGVNAPDYVFVMRQLPALRLPRYAVNIKIEDKTLTWYTTEDSFSQRLDYPACWIAEDIERLYELGKLSEIDALDYLNDLHVLYTNEEYLLKVNDYTYKEIYEGVRNWFTLQPYRRTHLVSKFDWDRTNCGFQAWKTLEHLIYKHLIPEV